MTSQKVRVENRRKKETKGEERSDRQYYNDVVGKMNSHHHKYYNILGSKNVYFNYKYKVYHQNINYTTYILDQN